MKLLTRKVIFLALFLLPGISLFAQSGKGYDKNYHFLTSGNITADKIFYLTTVISQSPDVMRLIAENSDLAAIYKTKRNSIHGIATANSTPGVDSVYGLFKWNRQDSVNLDQAMRSMYKTNPVPFDQLINNHLRPSGYYQRFVTLDNIDFLMRAWGQYLKGINYIIDQYGLGKKMRYPAIDSASYDAHGEYYSYMIDQLFNFLDEKAADMNTFYEPSLAVSLKLMDANDRDEPARFEPLEEGENKAAAKKVKQTDWNKYTYSAILVPGEGPELPTEPLSLGGKIRCELAAARFKKGIAPFVILSGGYCHPFHTSYCEAIEMKKYLMSKFGIPENAIIVEPQARHTTTNFRNGGRLMIRYGMPVDKKAICVTASDQAAGIASKGFDNRNMKELGYLPYKDKEQIAIHEIIFYPVIECLHTDPFDPLDP